MESIATMIQSTVGDEKHYDSNGNDTKYLDGLELETRYRELSRTLSQFNGDDAYGLYSKNDHMNENSGVGPLSSAISDDEDLAILSGAGITDDQELGSGFTFQTPVSGRYANNNLDFGEDNSLVDILSSKIDQDDKNGRFTSVEDDLSKESSSTSDADNFLNATNKVDVFTTRTFATSTASPKAVTLRSTMFRTKSDRHDPSTLTMATSATVTVISKARTTTGASGSTRTTIVVPQSSISTKAAVEKKTSLAMGNRCWSMLIFLALLTFIRQWTML